VNIIKGIWYCNHSSDDFYAATLVVLPHHVSGGRAALFRFLFFSPFFLSPFLRNLFRCTQLIPMRATKAYHKLAPLENERKWASPDLITWFFVERNFMYASSINDDHNDVVLFVFFFSLSPPTHDDRACCQGLASKKSISTIQPLVGL